MHIETLEKRSLTTCTPDETLDHVARLLCERDPHEDQRHRYRLCRPRRGRRVRGLRQRRALRGHRRRQDRGHPSGKLPIFEPGLQPLVEHNIAAGRLRFTTSNAEAAVHGDIIFLAVGTPTLGSDSAADLSFLFQAAAEIGRHLERPAIIVDKSTVPVGTAERVARIIAEHTKQPFVVVSNPEFLKEGAAVDDFMHPDRIIIGTTDEQARQTLHRLYQPFCRTNDRIIFMDARSAELTKYACNAYLATRISFMNDMANLADSVGADIELVRRGMGSDPRIGPKFLFPGVGYGGSCFPKDIRAS
jgi:UDPglucose 6-dehydrogenase